MVRHVGFAVCEGTGHVIPLESHYCKKSHAESVAHDRIMAAWGLEATEVHLFPASQEEAVRELVEGAVSDSQGYQMTEAFVLAPSEDAPEWEARVVDVRGMGHAECIAALESMGYSGRWSKGGNVWVDKGADPGDPVLKAAGLRWAAKRGQWWIRTADWLEAVAADPRAAA